MNIYGLKDFGVSESEIGNKYSEINFELSIHLKYYSEIDELKPMTPKQRRLIICQFLRDSFKHLKARYPNETYELIGTRTKPLGLNGQLKGKELAVLLKEDLGERIFIKCIKGKEKKTKPKKPYFFSVQALFASKTEGINFTNSIRLTEERILLVKAINSEDAKEKAMLEFNAYAESENINGDYRFTSWEFIEIMDVYETDVEEINPLGTEVFSIWKNRKIKKSS